MLRKKNLLDSLKSFLSSSIRDGGGAMVVPATINRYSSLSTSVNLPQ